MNYTIYKIINLINNKEYTGAHITEDVNDTYMGSGKLIKIAINKYGLSNFSKEILHNYNNKDDMFNKELELVNEEYVKRRDTYNMKCGGSGGFCKNLVSVLDTRDNIKKQVSIEDFNEFDYYIGHTSGSIQSQESNLKRSETMKGLKASNQAYIKSSKRIKGTKYMNDGEQNFRVKKEDIIEKLKDGLVMGMLLKPTKRNRIIRGQEDHSTYL